MKPALAQNVGVDIAKDTLDVAILPAGESFRLANDPGGHRALIKARTVRDAVVKT